MPHLLRTSDALSNFRVRLLQRVQKGEVTERAALKSIHDARCRADDVRQILRELGDADESVPLSRRYQRMMRRPIDLAADERSIELRGELMLAVAELVHLLERDFLGENSPKTIPRLEPR